MVALAFCQGGTGRCYPSSNAARRTPTSSSASTARSSGRRSRRPAAGAGAGSTSRTPPRARRPARDLGGAGGRAAPRPVRVHAGPAVVGRPRGAVVLGHGRVPARGGARARAWARGSSRPGATTWTWPSGLGLTPSSYGLSRSCATTTWARCRSSRRCSIARAVARAAPGAALAGAVGAPVLRARPGRCARAGAAAAGARRRGRGRATGFGAEYDALWERARGVLRHVRAAGRAPTSTGSTRRCPHRQLRRARRRGARASSAGFAVSRHEDYRGLRLGWIVDVFADADDHDGAGRAARRGARRLPRARAWRARRPSP